MRKNSFIKGLLFVLTMVLMSVFAIQQRAKIWVFKPLEGVFEPAPTPELNFENCRTGQFQAQLEPYLKEHLGFREPLIRFYNQFLYDFFRTTYSKEVVIGKDHWTYFRQHVNEYYGTEMYRWYDTDEEARADFDRESRLMWKLRGVLHDYDIEFLMFMAPDKGYLYPEHLPFRKRDTTTVNAREYYASKFDEYGFPYIEMTKWFLDLKEADTLPYSLMPQCGAHWGFSAVLAADSLFRFMGHLNGQRLPEMQIGPLHESSPFIVKGDRDLENTLNLMRPLPRHYDKLLDAEVTIKRESATIWPSVLFVGNSFLWRMFDFIPFDDMFAHSEYWFYNSTAHFGKRYQEHAPVEGLDLLQRMLDCDYIVWFTDGNQMYKTSYRFVENALMKLCLSDERVSQRRVQLMDSLSADTATLAWMKDYSSEKRTSELWEKANRMMRRDPEKHFPELAGDSIPTSRNPRIPEALTIKDIKQDTAWMKNLQCQTVIRNTTLEQVLRMEAQNVLNGRPLMRDEPNVFSRQTYVESLVKAMEETILGNEELSRMAKEKSERNGITFEEQVNADARWIVNYQIDNGEIVF
ncbi:MAG: hypothetical protein IJP44_09060 [Bacteroidales bacterium]|nr:hypothetical protein [Bacteroidales bacterium]